MNLILTAVGITFNVNNLFTTLGIEINFSLFNRHNSEQNITGELKQTKSNN
jgi:hypothetical protein